uniref:Ninjurin 1 n=1 Tax=Astyanax mexicanus TaxID=7994 RepID=A0A8B9I053_ASTMX
MSMDSTELNMHTDSGYVVQASHDRHVPPSSLNMNHYANKKSAAESMLDIALLMANASQLKAVLEQGPQFNFYAPLITLISLSLGLQIMVGVLLIFIGKKGTQTLF